MLSRMPKTLEVSHISVSVERAADEVYRFASNVESWSRWAAGLGRPLRRDGDAWIFDSPMGELRVRLAEPNAYRVLDHDVTLPSGLTVHNALRVLPNSAGSEVVFSVFRQPGTSDDAHEQDKAAVARDLRTLKGLLET
jgi:hypothetical protein